MYLMFFVSTQIMFQIVLIFQTVINNILFKINSVAPRVELNLGPAVNPRDLEEGDDVYFECHIQAHPPAYKVTWRHKVR